MSHTYHSTKMEWVNSGFSRFLGNSSSIWSYFLSLSVPTLNSTPFFLGGNKSRYFAVCPCVCTFIILVKNRICLRWHRKIVHSWQEQIWTRNETKNPPIKGINFCSYSVWNNDLVTYILLDTIRHKRANIRLMHWCILLKIYFLHLMMLL